jgi:hypothetical protein
MVQTVFQQFFEIKVRNRNQTGLLEMKKSKIPVTSKIMLNITGLLEMLLNEIIYCYCCAIALFN